MKTPHLLASLAVAVTAAAADTKDPAQVIREWNVVANQPLAPWAGNLSLLAEIPKPAPRAAVPPVLLEVREKQKGGARIEPWGRPIPRNKIHDAPNYSVPGTLPDNMPPGSKPWRYGGQDYWLIPLIPSQDK